MSKKFSSMKKKRRIQTTIIVIVMFVVSLLAMFPFYWMILNSLKNPTKIFEQPIKLFTFDLTFESYKEIFVLQEGLIFRSYLNSLIISILLTVGTLFTSSLAAFALAKIKFKGSNLLFAIFIATLMIPGQVTTIPLFVIFSKVGFIDTFIPLILPGVLINTYGVFMLRQFIVSIPNELMEAADVDGCGYFRKYWQIVVPLCAPALISLGLFTFIGSYNNFFGQLIYLSSPENTTIALFIKGLKETYGSGAQWGRIMAATTLSIVPISIIYLSCQKYFVEGIATTGIK